MDNATQIRSTLLKIAKLYAKKEGVALATVSAKAGFHGSTLPRIEEGEPVNLKINTVDDAMAWFRANWPPGGALPKELHRR